MALYKFSAIYSSPASDRLKVLDTSIFQGTTCEIPNFFNLSIHLSRAEHSGSQFYKFGEGQVRFSKKKTELAWAKAFRRQVATV